MNSKATLSIIVFSQLFCTSLWFAGNAVLEELITTFNLNTSVLAYLTSSVQLGFILGTLIFALLSIADRFSPSKVFFVCALLGATFNFCITWNENTLSSLLIFRFLTGFFLAGIYPVGMKIAADYFDKGLGKSLGFLVGALVIGTALPHLLSDIKGDLLWTTVLFSTSFLALVGGLLMFFLVPDGPFRKSTNKVNLKSIPLIFKESKFRHAAFGYFGHMWELYTFWAFIPLMLKYYFDSYQKEDYNTTLWSFCIISSGGIACVLGSIIAERFGTIKVAKVALFISGLCCLLAPFMFQFEVPFLFLSFLLIWGMSVVADSPLLSTLVAQNAPSELKGTALTIVNCIGYMLTIISIQLLQFLKLNHELPYILTVLSIGPMIGIYFLSKRNKAPLVLEKEEEIVM